MSSFEDTLVNPNYSSDRYQSVNTSFTKTSDSQDTAKSRIDDNDSGNKIDSANVFTVGLFIVLATTFLYVVSHAF
ncbi:MAG: hypothetical protein AAGB35_08050 [Pseudomonadota bacterium]